MLDKNILSNIIIFSASFTKTGVMYLTSLPDLNQVIVLFFWNFY